GPADVAVSRGGDSSLLVRTPRGDLSLALPAGVAFETGSCIHTPVGEPGGEELHFRLRIMIERSERGTLQASDSRLCFSRFLSSRAFSRVLPLPNGNWNAIVDDWCCHPDPFANKKLLPRAEDCLLGDTFVLVARDTGCDHTLTQEVTSVGGADGQDPKVRWHLKTVAARLLDLSSSLSSFHFSLQTPDGKVVLLVRCKSQLLCMFVIFRIVTSWEVNSIGHPVVLPLQVCEELLEVMDESNSTLPASMRCMRCYEVRHLQYLAKPPIMTAALSRISFNLLKAFVANRCFELFSLIFILLKKKIWF
uniref:E3 ubiquitin-protein ligase E3D n=1 Tax=Xiphophorus couchianus TaxID=32473 RepID=A0A3B5MEJ3_9TELE